jgi:hypothetical protein
MAKKPPEVNQSDESQNNDNEISDTHCESENNENGDTESENNENEQDYVMNVIDGDSSEDEDIVFVPHVSTVTRFGRHAGNWKSKFAASNEVTCSHRLGRL